MKKLLYIISGLLCFNTIPGQTNNNPLNNSYKGLSDGSHIQKFANGQIKVKMTKVNGNVHGEHFVYFKNGRLREFEMFDNGRFNGVNFTLDENGDTLVVEKFQHDTLVFYRQRTYYKNRVCKSYQAAIIFDQNSENNFPNAKEIINVTYDVNKLLENRKVKVIYKKYYESGNLKSEGVGMSDKGKYNGPFKEYYENGKTATSSTYLNGQLDGEFIEYSSDGSIKKKLLYNKGVVVK